MKITLEHLAKAQTCKTTTRRFAKLFPKGATFNQSNLVRWLGAYVDEHRHRGEGYYFFLTDLQVNGAAVICAAMGDDALKRYMPIYQLLCKPSLVKPTRKRCIRHIKSLVRFVEREHKKLERARER